LIVFVLSGCIFRTTTEEEKTLFIPINRIIYEEKSIYSYTIKDAIEGDNIHIFSRFSEKEIDKKEDKLQLSKKVENSFSSIPEDSNLWIEIYWYDYDDAFWKKEQTIKPDGYNVYLNKTFVFFINFILYFKNEADKYRNRKNYS